jgi:hypothetical protein
MASEPSPEALARVPTTFSAQTLASVKASLGASVSSVTDSPKGQVP